MLIDEEVLRRLDRYVPLAPLHQPHNLAPIRMLLARRPDLPQVACFDTAFHRGHGALADHYAIPEHFYAEGVRRYGFHGLSYEYIAQRLREVAPGIASGRVIVAHLGSGASMCALSDGRSIDSTLGFTALDGLPMGTRCGQIDPGVILYLIAQKGMTVEEVQDLLYREMRPEGSFRRQQRCPRRCNRVPIRARLSRWTISSTASDCTPECWRPPLAGSTLLCSPPGSARTAAELRARIAEKLGWLGAALDPAANVARQPADLDAPKAASRSMSIPTDEELMIARHTLASDIALPRAGDA